MSQTIVEAYVRKQARFDLYYLVANEPLARLTFVCLELLSRAASRVYVGRRRGRRREDKVVVDQRARAQIVGVGARIGRVGVDVDKELALVVRVLSGARVGLEEHIVGYEVNRDLD